MKETKLKKIHERKIQYLFLIESYRRLYWSLFFFFFCLVYMKVRSRYVLSRRFSSYVIVFQSFNVVYWLVYDPESAFHFFFFYGRHRLFWRWSYWLSRKIPVFSLWKNERQTCESQPTEKEKKTFSHLLDAVVIVFSDQLV